MVGHPALWYPTQRKCPGYVFHSFSVSGAAGAPALEGVLTGGRLGVSPALLKL